MKAEPDNVGIFEMRVRPGFVIWLLVLFVGIPWLFSLLRPVSDGKTRARISATRLELQALAGLWGRERVGSVGLPLSTNGALQLMLLGDDDRTGLSNFLYRTNSAGELVDFWQTPIRFEPGESTNVIICSAGPNRKFGTKDDLVFNSASNSLVKS